MTLLGSAMWAHLDLLWSKRNARMGRNINILCHAWIPAVLITALRVFWSWGMLYCIFCLNTCRSEHGTHSILYCLPNLNALSWERPSDPHAALQTFNKQLDAEDCLSIAWKTSCPTAVTLYKTYVSADCSEIKYMIDCLYSTWSGGDKNEGKICIGSKRSMEKERITIADILNDNLSATQGKLQPNMRCVLHLLGLQSTSCLQMKEELTHGAKWDSTRVLFLCCWGQAEARAILLI